MKLLIAILLLCLNVALLAHEGHHAGQIISAVENIGQAFHEGQPEGWLAWIGRFHLVFLHFPIALINMLAISELLLMRTRNQNFDFSSRFLMISSAIITPLTSFLGLIYSYSSNYEGLMETFFLFHMWFGFLTTLMILILPVIRIRKGLTGIYWIYLLVLVALVNAAGFFGGVLSFGLPHLLPPL